MKTESAYLVSSLQVRGILDTGVSSTLIKRQTKGNIEHSIHSRRPSGS